MAIPAGIVLCAVGRSVGLRSDGPRVPHEEVARTSNRIVGIGDRADRRPGRASFAILGPTNVRTARFGFTRLARLRGAGATAEDAVAPRRAMLAVVGTPGQTGHDDGRQQHEKGSFHLFVFPFTLCSAWF